MFRILGIKALNKLRAFRAWLNEPLGLDFDYTVKTEKDIDMNRATIFETSTGRFALATSEGVVATYSRARDARRGARRAGLVVA